MPGVGLILLAAGASTRMGRPKQLLAYQGTTLVRHCAQVALEAGCSPVVVVLGANADQIRPELAGLNVVIGENGEWELGPGTSLRAGLAALLGAAPDVEAVLIALADQPLITADDLRRLMSARTPVAAASFNDTVGSPALFRRSYFDKLAKLSDAAGAKSILLSASADLSRIVMPQAAADVDTPDDFAAL